MHSYLEVSDLPVSTNPLAVLWHVKRAYTRLLRLKLKVEASVLSLAGEHSSLIGDRVAGSVNTSFSSNMPRRQTGRTADVFQIKRKV